MKKSFNNKPFKQMKLTEKIVFLVLVSTIFILMFFSVYGGIHAIREDLKKNSTTAYADVYNEEIASFDYASPVFRTGDTTIAYLATFRYTYNFTTNLFEMQPYYNNDFSIGDQINLFNHVGLANRYSLTLRGTYTTGSSQNTTVFPLFVWLSNTVPDNIIGIEKIYSYYSQSVNGSTTFYTFEIYVDFISDDGVSHPTIITFGNPDAPYVPLYSPNLILDVRYPKLYSGDEILLDISKIMETSYKDGLADGKVIASEESYQRGLADGLELAENSSFYDLIDSVFYGFGKFIYSMFSFEILGVNMYGFIITIISVGLVAFILRLVL